MKKLVISSLIIILGTCAIAQDKIHCLKNNKPIEHEIDSANSDFYTIKIKGNSCSSTIFSIPSEYYLESDSIIIRMRKKQLYDSNDNIKASYCYSIGLHNISLFLDPNLFRISTCGKNNLIYSIELFYPDDKNYGEIRNQSFPR
jgi:hypothetical protein